MFLIKAKRAATRRMKNAVPWTAAGASLRSSTSTESSDSRSDTSELHFDQPKPLAQFGMFFDENGKVFTTAEYTVDDSDGFRLSLGSEVMVRMQELGLEKVPVTYHTDLRHPSRFGFCLATPDFLKKSEVMLLLHHSGYCYAGMWSPMLVMEEGLVTGSMGSYVREGHRKGMGVVLANPRMTSVAVSGEPIPLLNSKTSIEHLDRLLWLCTDEGVNVESVYIVAHSDASVLVQRYLEMNRYTLNVHKIKHICLIGGNVTRPENFAVPYPTVTTWSTGPLSRKDRNIFISNRYEIYRWPYRCIHSVFAIVGGGSFDKAQLMIDSEEPFDPKAVDTEIDDDEDDDPFADYL